MIYRGIEDIFGNIWQFVDGINIKDYQTYICYDKNQYASDKFDGCYQPIGYVNAKTDGNWISKLGYDASNPLIAFPVETNGTPNTHITDMYNSNSGSRIALVGGVFLWNIRCGFWYWNFFESSTVSQGGMCARLIKTN